MPRCVTAVLAALALVACTGSSSHDGSTAASSTTTGSTVAGPLRVELGDLTFTVPGTWRFHADGARGTLVILLGYWSSEPLGLACSSQVEAGGERSGCSVPLATLPAGGVVVSWSNIGEPLPTGQQGIEAPNTTIGGQSARLTIDDRGSCPSLVGPTTVITTDIARHGGYHFEMRACLGPDAGPAQRDVTAMLDSVRFGA